MAIQTKAEVFDVAFKRIEQMTRKMNEVLSKINAGGLDGQYLRLVLMTLKDARAKLEPIMTSIDVDALAAEVLINPPANLSTKWSAALSKGEEVSAEAVQLLDEDADGYARILKVDHATGKEIWRTYTPQELATLKTKIEELIALIPQ